jgi:hypothetical protein
MIQSYVVAIDGSAINAYKHALRRKIWLMMKSCQLEAKIDTHRNQITWFGYKLNLPADIANKLSIAAQLGNEQQNDCVK